MPIIPDTEIQPDIAPMGEGLGGSIGGVIAATQNRPPAPGIMETAWRSYESTVSGTLGNTSIPNWIDGIMLNESDGFDPYAIATDEFFNSHPWMVKPYMNGTMDSFNNSQRFWQFEARQRENYDNTQRVGEAGFLTQLAGGAVGMAPEILLTSGAGHLVGGLARGGAAVGTWAREGGYMARTLKAAGVGGVTNLAYDKAVTAINPNRFGDEGPIHDVETIGMGMVFGGAFSTIVDGLSGELTRGRAKQIVTGVTETVAAPEAASMADVAKRDAEIAKTTMPAWEVLPVDVFTPNEIDQLRLMGGDELKSLLGDVDAIARGEQVPPGLGSAIMSRLMGVPEPIVTAPQRVPATLGQSQMSRLLGDREPVPADATFDRLLGGDANIPGVVKSTPLDVLLAGKPVATDVSKSTPFAPTQDIPAHAGPSDLQSLLAGKPVPTEVVPPAKSFPTKQIVASDLDKLMRGESVPTEISPTPKAFQPQHAPSTQLGAADVDRIVDEVKMTRQVARMKAALQGFNFAGSEFESVIASVDAPARKIGEKFPGIVALDVSNPEVAAAIGSSKVHVTLLRDPANPAPYDAAVAAAKATHGEGNVVFEQHPDQFYMDERHALSKLDTASRGKTADFVMDLGTAVPGFDSALKDSAHNPSRLARTAYRSLFDITRPTVESVDNPLNHTVHIPAEAHKWQLELHHNNAVLAVEQARKDGVRGGGFAYTFTDGRKVQFSRTTPTSVFEDAVMEHMRVEEAIAAKRRPADGYKAPEAIAKAAKVYRDYYAKMGEEARAIGMLPKDAPIGQYRGSRRYNAEAIRTRREEFIQKLVDTQEKARVRDFETGKNIVPDERPINEDAIDYKRAERKVIKDAAGQEFELGLTADEKRSIEALANRNTAPGAKKFTVADVTEGEMRLLLGDDLLKRYHEEVSLLHRAQAESMTDHILNPENAHGVEAAMPSPTKKRLVQLDELDFKDFLDNNAGNVLGAYSHTMSGRIAVRKGIKPFADVFDPYVKARNIDSTTKKPQGLAELDYDPKAMLQAVRDHFQQWTDFYARKGEAANAEKMAEQSKTTLRYLEGNLARLEGRPVFPNNPAADAGWAPFLGKQLGKAVYTAGMGKMAVSQVADAAVLVARRRIGEAQIGTCSRFLEFVAGLSRADQEMIYIAKSDRAQAFKAAEFGDIANPTVNQFGTGLRGKFDTATDAATNTFTKLTGIRQISGWQKRWAAGQLTQEYIRGIRLMVKADELVKAGKPLQDALRRVGLSGEDATRLNAAGFTADSGRELLGILREHGLSYEGNPIKDFDRHGGIVQPNMQAWAKTHPAAFERLTRAINSEVQSLIVEPKILSKPLMNATWMGRAFNQFQTFSFAWGGQALPLIMQSSKFDASRYFLASIGAGIVIDALQNSLSGRRSLEDSVKQLQENPMGSIYAGVLKSPVLGWLGRPMGLLEQTSVGPGKLLGNQAISTQYARPELTAGDFAGPVFGWLDNLVRGASGSMIGEYNDSRSRRLWRALPFHNLWQIELLNRTVESMGYGTPVGPEPIHR